MPKIGNISLKTPIESTDKLLGSDTLGVPKNYDIDTIQEYVNSFNINVGITATTVPTFTDNGDGTATIGASTVAIRDNANSTGLVKEYSISSDTFTFTDGTEEYINVNYNSGTPIYEKTTIPSNGSNNSLIYVVWRTGTILHYINQGSIANGLPNKTNARLINVEPYAVASTGGLLISETTSPANRTILVSSAIVYAGVVPHTINSFNSSSNTMYKVISDSSSTGWTLTAVTQYNNANYNPLGLGEVALDNNKYTFNLYYRSISSANEVFFVESESQYNSASEARIASESGRTSLPLILRNHCLFIGRSIIQKDADTGETTSFVRRRGEFTSFIPEHNELSGIDGGTTDEYNHLTDSEYSYVQDLPKIGDVSGGDYTEFESDGTMIAHGDATCWDDIALGVGQLGAGGSAPDSINTNSSGIYLFGFDGVNTTEQLFGTFEMPHTYAEGTDIVPHVHWAPTTTGTGNVKWCVDFWRIDDTSPIIPSTPTTICVVAATDGTAWKVFRSDTTTVTGTNFKIGDQVGFRLYRNPSDAEDTYGADAVVLTFGIHYQINSLGSRNIISK